MFRLIAQNINLERVEFPMTRFIAMLALIITALGVNAPLQARDYKVGDLKILSPWTQETIGGQKTGAVYFKIESSGAADKLVAAKTSAAMKTMIHMSMMKDGAMTMNHMEDVAIPAGGSVEFKKGGLHVMLMGVGTPLKKGESHKLTLTFEKAGPVEVEFSVEKLGFKPNYK